MKKKIGAMVFIIGLLVLYGTLWAAEFKPVKCICPACVAKFWARSVVSTSRTGMDRDFRPLHSGESPLDYMAITCPNCHFTAYIEDYQRNIHLSDSMKKAFADPGFPKPPDGVQASAEPDPFREEVITYLTSNGASVNAEDIHMAARFPAYVGLDMLAQTYKRIGRNKLNIGWVYLEAGWAVRRNSVMEIRTVMQDSTWEDLMRRAIDIMTDDAAEVKKLENESDQGVEMSSRAMKKASAKSGKDKEGLLLFSIFINRYHGENTRVIEALTRLEGLMDAELYAKFKDATTKSIMRERRYQVLAAENLVPAIDEIDNPVEKANHLYLCGEVYRRLENWKEAMKYYELAEQLGTADDTRKVWIKEQRTLMPDTGK